MINFDPNRYPATLQAVQLLRLFGDSKTFPDAIVRGDAATLQAVEAQVQQLLKNALRDAPVSDFVTWIAPVIALTKQIKALVEPLFEAPRRQLPTSEPIPQRIDRLWNELIRQSREFADTSIIQLPHPYIVPGGRYGETYYWDSHFVREGLLRAGRRELAHELTANCAQLIRTFGYVPNGNRTYYVGRSQPPFFSFMIDEPPAALAYEDALATEYDYWMDRQDNGHPSRYHAPSVLNHYSDANQTPRPEGYWEDVETALSAARHGRPHAESVFRNLRAAAESGWDFSSRWLAPTSAALYTIRTTEILPVDLNSLLYYQEMKLARLASARKDSVRASAYSAAAGRRREAMLRLMWDDEGGWFRDCDIQGRQTSVLSLAGIFPLFAGLLDPLEHRAIAKKLAATLRDRFLQPGGLVTTLTLPATGQQWDWPNGWAPLQLVAVRGLVNYGFRALARECAQRFRNQVERVYRDSGRIMEKYDVVDIDLPGGGGEYSNQDGFAWTNAVYLVLEETLLAGGISHPSAGA